MLEELKKQVLAANKQLVTNKLVIYTWGNVSAIDRSRGLVVIKPSGVSYDDMSAEDMVVVDTDGNIVEGDKRPSVDLPTHLQLYRSFEGIGGVVHTHSTFATAFAQAGLDIQPFGTTHADYFFGAIPCTRKLTRDEVENDYELNTGRVIAETFANKNYLDVPAAIVGGHGLFAWGQDAPTAVYNATVAERCAEMAYLTCTLKDAPPIDDYMLEKHYLRKHGKNATYGQVNDK